MRTTCLYYTTDWLCFTGKVAKYDNSYLFTDQMERIVQFWVQHPLYLVTLFNHFICVSLMCLWRIHFFLILIWFSLPVLDVTLFISLMNQVLKRTKTFRSSKNDWNCVKKNIDPWVELAKLSFREPKFGKTIK